jgi:hypothetical protein
MPHVLHLLKAGDHPTAQSVIERQSRQPGTTVTVVLLHGASVSTLPKASQSGGSLARGESTTSPTQSSSISSSPPTRSSPGS